jgi:hypothetical protein
VQNWDLGCWTVVWNVGLEFWRLDQTAGLGLGILEINCRRRTVFGDVGLGFGTPDYIWGCWNGFWDAGVFLGIPDGVSVSVCWAMNRDLDRDLGG